MGGGERLKRIVTALSAAAVMAIGVAVAIGATSAGGAQRAATQVSVKLVEFKLIPSPKRVPAGKVTFVAQNAGKIAHELVVLKTATPAAKLAVKGTKAVEAGKVGKIAQLKPGATRKLTLTLKPGHYVLLCNLPGHYKLGQRADLTVTPTTGTSTGGTSTGGGLSGIVQQGKKLYESGPPGLGYGCARCHGLKALGDTGPKIVGKSAAAIRQAIGTVALMQGFTGLTDSQIDAIAAYLQYLATGG